MEQAKHSKYTSLCNLLWKDRHFVGQIWKALLLSELHRNRILRTLSIWTTPPRAWDPNNMICERQSVRKQLFLEALERKVGTSLFRGGSPPNALHLRGKTGGGSNWWQYVILFRSPQTNGFLAVVTSRLGRLFKLGGSHRESILDSSVEDTTTTSKWTPSSP